MGYTKEQEAWIWLSSVRKLGTQRFHLLLERYGSAQAVWDLPAEETAFLGKASNSALQQARTDEYRTALFLSIARCGAVAITQEDAEYPPLLLEIPDAPPTLYVRGRKALGDSRTIAIVGSRNCTPYGTRVARRLARELAQMGVTIVSGFARGIDSEAHRGAAEVGGRTVAVFGSGVDVVYPPENLALADALLEAGGSIVSASLPGVPPVPTVFPARNRIISGMSEATVLVEASRSSGAMLTADFALAQNRELFAVPGQVDQIYSEGTHWLIRSRGARLLTCAADLAVDLGWQDLSLFHPQPPRSAEVLPLSLQQQALWNLLAAGPMDADELPAALGLSASQVNSLLTEMEIQGIIIQSPGRRVERA